MSAGLGKFDLDREEFNLDATQFDRDSIGFEILAEMFDPSWETKKNGMTLKWTVGVLAEGRRNSELAECRNLFDDGEEQTPINAERHG